MQPSWHTIEFSRADALAHEASESRRVVVVSTGFMRPKNGDAGPRQEELSALSVTLLDECIRVLSFGDLLFVYGAPRALAFWGRHLDRAEAHGARMVFKYWIALDLNDAPRGHFLTPAHLGLLLFQKVRANRLSPTPFPLAPSGARVPHQRCAACGRFLKDWGGKKHLMNPAGAALSDVWRDLQKLSVRDGVAPAVVLERIAALTKVRLGESSPNTASRLEAPNPSVELTAAPERGPVTRSGFAGLGTTTVIQPALQVVAAAGHRPALRGQVHGVCLHIVQRGPGISACREPARSDLVLTAEEPPAAPAKLHTLERNWIYRADCVKLLERVARLHPRGVFDLVFADPPYNLEKRYDTYADALAERHYVAWCERWLDGLARTLKPGGSLFVVNLPRWAMHHAAFLNARLEFRHWIAWDALSEPRGRLMPAHYALLYYTKPGAAPVFNYALLTPARSPSDGERVSFNSGQRRETDAPGTELVQPPDAPKYCLRASCLRARKAARDDDRVELSDVWFDVHRIKHKRDRDAHPCQLPEKLMERLIRLATRPGDLVFDPFCGAGTTAIAAAKLGRDYIMVDLDPSYVRITEAKLAAMKQAAEVSGTAAVPRPSVLRPRKPASKRAIELALQTLARDLGRMPTEADLAPELLKQIALIYPYPGAALKRAKVVLPG